MARKKSCVPLLPWHSSSGGDSSKTSPDDTVRTHKPISLRTSFSVICLVYTLALIAALEYCFGTFPTAESRRSIPDGRGYEIWGPFNSAPLGRVVATADTPANTAILTTPRSWNITTTTEPLSTSVETLSVSTPIITSAASLPIIPSSASPSPSPIPSKIPDNWDEAYDQVVMFGLTPGIPGYALNISREEPSWNQTVPGNSSTLNRRVPPRDKWGQLSGRVQYVIFDVLGWKYHDRDPWTVASYVWYHYLKSPNVANPQPKDNAYLKIMKDKAYCPIVCDGPALVFLETYCWDGWRNKASLYSRRLSEQPGATTTQSADVWGDATVCATITKDKDAGGGGGGPMSNLPPWTGAPGIPVSITTTIRGVKTTLVVVTPAPTALPVVGTARPTSGAGGGGGQPDPSNPNMHSEITEVWITTTLVKEDNMGRPVTTITAVLRAIQPTITLVDSWGNPTATITTHILLAPGVHTVNEIGDGDTVPGLTTTITTGMVPLGAGTMMILTDSKGIPIATLRGTRDSEGRPGVAVKPDSATGDRMGDYVDGDDGWDGSTSTTSTTDGGASENAKAIHPLSWGDYLVASFSPILMALPLAMLIQIQSSTIKELLPFYLLSRTGEGGVSAGKSLCLTTGGVQGLVNSMRLLLRDRDPLLFLADLHVLVSSLAVSFSSEALGIKLYGHCTADDFTGCRMGIAVFRSPGRMLEAFLIATVLINLAINMLLIRRSAWKTALEIYSRQGGTISATTSLLSRSSPETRYYFRKIIGGLPHGMVSNKEMKRHFERCLFSVRSSSLQDATLIQREEKSPPAQYYYYLTITPPSHAGAGNYENTTEHTSPPWHQRLVRIFTSRHQDTINQVAFLLAVSGFLIMLFYYELTSTTSAFEQFMNSQGLGVRAVFTGLGIIISLFWDNYFSNVATQEPYRQLTGRYRPTTSSSTSTVSSFGDPAPTTAIPSTAFAVLFNPFFLLRKGVFTRHKFLVLVAFTTALSKITPLLLSNVPFSPWLTWTTHEVCTWSTISILFLMMFVLLCGMVIGWLRRRRRRRDTALEQPWVEVDLATLGGKMVFGTLYCGGNRSDTNLSGYSTEGSQK